MTEHTEPSSFEEPDAADFDSPDTGAQAPESAADAATIVAALEAALAQQKEKYLRLAAEYDNFRKRSVRERQDAEFRGMGLLIRGILDALDDLGRFAHFDPASVDSETVVKGAEMVEKKIFKSLAGHGLEVLSPLGERFDPAVHEALTTVPAETAEEDHLIAQVFQVGYLFNGQLLRAARVVVKQWHGSPARSASRG